MADSDILKQIALLNPRIINGNEGSNVDYILNNGSSSPSEVNTDITDNQLIENDDDNDILNLWSSTKIFFDPFDPSKINPTTQSQDTLNVPSLNSNNIDASSLSEREIDRQRYNRLKQQQQNVYAQRGRRSPKENVDHNNIFNKNNLLDIDNFHNLLLNNDNTNNHDNKKNTIENNLLQASTSTSTVHSLAVNQNLIQNISLPTDNDPKLNNSLNTIDNNHNSNKKSKDLYTQLLDSINLDKDININANGKRNIVNKTNESRSKEIAEKKKRRSAATMRCRERKKNQLQKKEQYIKYLENQILFLNGSILHMSNEITWLRRSFLDQYGEQSLKNIYLKNGFKNVNLNNVLYPGANGVDFPDFNPTNSSNLFSQGLSLNNINLGDHEHNKQENKNHHHQNPTSSSNIHTSSLESTVFLNSLTSHDSVNKNNALTTTPVQSSNSNTSLNLSLNSSTKSSSIPNSNIGSNFLSSFTNNTPQISSATTTSFNSISSTAIPESLSDQKQSKKNIFNQLDIDTLNQFASLSKEQRDILLKILEKQQELSQPQKSKPITTSSSLQSQDISVSLPPPLPPSSQASRNFINIANDEENINHYSKPQNSLLNLESVSTSVPTTDTINHFHDITTNSIFNSFHSQSLNSISFQNTSLPPSNPNNLTTTTSELLTTLSSNVHNSPEKGKSSDNIPTSNTSNPTTTTQQDDYINLENLIYYI